MGTDSNPPTQPLYFDCNMCGECCSSWNIPIEAEKARRLLEKPWVQARLAETNRQLTPMTKDTYRIPLTDENVCVFLAEDRRCMVENREGTALKPHECQRFPFATVRLPDGTDWHETSAACKSISEKLLLAFQPILPKPAVEEPVEADGWPDFLAPIAEGEQEAGLLAALEPTAHFPKRVPVSGFRTISQADYQRYQHHLRDIFMATNVPPQAALFQAWQLLRQVAAGQFNTLTGQPPEASGGRSFNPAMAHLLTVGFLRKPYRTLSWVSLLRGQSYPDPRIFGLPVNLPEQRRMPWRNRPDNRLDLRLNAFLFNLLQRKRLIALGSSLSAHLAMAGMACLLVQWYAKTLAWLQDGAEISEKDISTAIRLVERYYTGHQPRFLAFFTSRWRGELVNALLFSLTSWA